MTNAMLSDLISTVGLALDIFGVLALLYATSQKNIDMAIGLAMYEELVYDREDFWLNEQEKQEYEQSATRTRGRLKWARRIYITSLILIVFGFGLQIFGNAMPYL